MEDELVKIVNHTTGTGYSTTRRSWMKPGDVIFGEKAVHEPEDMTIAQIKERLAFRNIDIPDGVTKKADLQALLDGFSE